MSAITNEFANMSSDQKADVMYAAMETFNQSGITGLADRAKSLGFLYAYHAYAYHAYEEREDPDWAWFHNPAQSWDSESAALVAAARELESEAVAV